MVDIFLTFWILAGFGCLVIDRDRARARLADLGYDNVTVKASETDPTTCEVSFDFTVAHGLNHIRLTAHITV